MIDNNNFQNSVSGAGLVGGGMREQIKQVSIEISHSVTEIVRLAAAALYTAQERCALDQPATMSRSQ